jgi:DNA ligase-1
MGRGCFNDLQSAVLSNDKEGWNDIIYYLLDVPALEAPFEQRISQFQRVQLPKHVKIVEMTQCDNNLQMEQLLSSVVSNGGEGLLARKPHSKYIPGALIKIQVDVHSMIR